MPLKKNKKIKEIKLVGLFQEAYSLFKVKNISNPALEVELLIAHVLKQDRVFVLSNPEYNLKTVEVLQFNKLVKARLAGWSLAVLLGSKEFYGLAFKVSKDVLVPRPETEIMVDFIFDYVKDKPASLILDIGTGSGAIITSLFKNLAHKDHTFYASDKSKSALLIAKANAKTHQAKINFLNGDLLKPYLPIIQQNTRDIVIAANLPYLEPSELLEPSIKKEPRSALLSGSDGLWHYRRLFQQLKYITGVKVMLICELNHQQAAKIEKLARASFPHSKTYFKNDYTGRIRFFILEF